MYTKCIQNIYHISINFCIHFVNKIKRTVTANFVCKMYTKVCQNVGYICIQTFCTHLVYISSDLQIAHNIKIVYTIFIQTSYRMYMYQ